MKENQGGWSLSSLCTAHISYNDVNIVVEGDKYLHTEKWGNEWEN